MVAISVAAFIAALTAGMAQAEPVEPHQFNQGFTLQGVILMIGLFTGVLTILGYFRKVRRENDADARARTEELKAEFRLHDASTDERLTKLETRVSDFMPRAEIEGKLEHEKVNRVTSGKAASERFDRHDRDITDIKVEIGKIGVTHTTLAASVDDLKAIVKDQGKDFIARLDKLTDTITHNGGGR